MRERKLPNLWTTFWKKNQNNLLSDYSILTRVNYFKEVPRWSMKSILGD